MNEHQKAVFLNPSLTVPSQMLVLTDKVVGINLEFLQSSKKVSE